MVNLAGLAGGTHLTELMSAGLPFRFLGFEVNICQALPVQSASNQIPCLLGDLTLSSLFGDRRAMTLRTSADYLFQYDMLALRATERIDVKNHDVGNANSSAALRVPGPVVMLQVG
jgi:HK97 family phage major capsid protein